MVARVTKPRPKFQLGRTLATPGALKAIHASEHSPAEFLDRHVCGEWGDVCPDDRQANEEALVDGSRLWSVYKTRLGTKLWVITEAIGDDGQRASTCVMLPDEY
jgi:hypothetical protein